MPEPLHVAVSLPIPGVQDTPPLPDLLEVARILDRAGIHALLLRAGHGGALDPLVLTGVLLAGTQQLGVVPEVAVVDQVPFHLARRLASLDHLSGGRAGVHLRPPAPFDPLAKLRLLELVTVLRGLWDSYADDAPLRDQAAGVYYRPEERQALNHRGRFYQVAGPLNLSRPPQGHPLLFLTLPETGHLPVVARVADVALLPAPEPGNGPNLRHALHTHLVQLGRSSWSVAGWVTWPPAPHAEPGSAGALADHLEHVWITGAAHGVQLSLPWWSPAAATVIADTVTHLRDRQVFTPARPGQLLRERFSLPRPTRQAVA